MDAIVYKSNTGNTKEYAAMLGRITGLPVYALGEKQPAAGAEIIYMGWLMAGAVNGYKKAAKKYRVRAVCGVGMGASGTQTDDVTAKNGLAGMPVFTLQGGFDINKLKGMYRFMMKTMAATAGKSLAAKQDKTPEEADMLDLLTNGGSRVSEENLAPVVAWWQSL